MVLGLGRVYSEEICLLSEVDKLVQVKDKKKIKKVYDSLQKILKMKIDAQVVLDKGVVKNITPFALKAYSDFEVKEFDSFSSALDSVLAEQVLIEKKSKASKAYDEKLKQMDKRIEMQVASMEKLERSSVENQRKGEWIYENYQKVKKLILSARKDKKREIVIKS